MAEHVVEGPVAFIIKEKNGSWTAAWIEQGTEKKVGSYDTPQEAAQALGLKYEPS